MPIKFYNTLTRKLEAFKPMKAKEVKMYSCGPTVYDYAHIGNFRSYVFADILKRFLKYSGFKVNHVMNITDVDDKTIKRSQEQGKTLKEFCDFYTKAFFDDMESMNINKNDFAANPKATETIPEMAELIKRLIKKGYAYKADDGSIYYSIKKFEDYGKLAKLEKTQLKAGASGRVSTDEYEKAQANDFVLWKAWNPKDGDVCWDIEKLGRGRPGWHIECSAMSMKYLGKQLDIHTGGIDLIFPHHQNEIAQSEPASGKKFVNYWLHCAHLIVDGKKMSKSLGNFHTLRDVLSKGYSKEALRLLLISAHYRSQLNFTFEALQHMENNIGRLRNFMYSLKNQNPSNVKKANNKKVTKLIEAFKNNFVKALSDDLDTPKALAAYLAFVNKSNILLNSDSVSANDIKKLSEALLGFDSVFGVLPKVEKHGLSQELIELIKERETARKNKDWKKSDELRDVLKEKGIIVEDTPTGTIWRPLTKVDQKD